MKQLFQTTLLLITSFFIAEAQNYNATISNVSISAIQISIEENITHSYYQLYTSDPSFEVYATYNSTEDFYLAMPLNETDTVDHRYSYHYADTIFISRAQYEEPGFIDTFEHVYLAFRVNKDGSYFYGWIEVYAPNIYSCVNYVPEIGCINYASIYALEFTTQAIQTSENEQIIAGKGNAKDFLVPVSAKQFTTPSISVFPNPTTDAVVINGLPEATLISVFDDKGTEVLKTHNNTIDFRNFSNGLYYIQTEEQSLKVIKQ